MRNVTNEFKEKLKSSAFRYNLNFTFPDGSQMSLTQDDLTQSGNRITNGCGSNAFALGNAVSKQFDFSVENYSGKWDGVDFFGAVVDVSVAIVMDNGTIQALNLGQYFVTESEETKTTIDVTAYDKMFLAGQKMYTAPETPTTMREILRSATNQGGLVVGDIDNVRNGGFSIQSVGENLTCRDVIGMCAMIAGGNAYVDQERGTVVIVSYNPDSAVQHAFTDLNDLTVGTDAIQITGVQTNAEDGAELYGNEGYVLSVENGLISGVESLAVKAIGDEVIGAEMRVISATNYRYPLCDIGDKFSVLNIKGETFTGYVTDIEYDFSGLTTIECNADSPVRNANVFYNSAEVKAIQMARKYVIQEKTAREQAIENLQKASTGLYETEQDQPDGSKISYLHDKPTLEESQLVIRISAESISISTDGGDTYGYGISLYDATLIINSIYTKGLDANYIKVSNTESVTDRFLTINDNIAELEKLVNSEIEYYECKEVPTLLNFPAWDFTYNIPVNDTVQLRDDLAFEYRDEYYKRNRGTLVYDSTTGLSYRFTYKNNQWVWLEIADTETGVILQRVADLQFTTDGLTSSVGTLSANISNNYYTIAQTDSKITQKANEISTSVSQTYATKTSLGDYATTSSVTSQITQKANEINATITEKTGASSIVSSINQSASTIKLNASHIQLEGIVTANSTFKIKTDGSFEATGGTIGGVTITNNGLYANNGTNGFGLWDSTVHDGIIFHAGSNTGNIGGAPFRVYKDGRVIATAGTIGGCSIVGGQLQVPSSNIGSLDASKITSGTLSADRISSATSYLSNLYVTNLYATNMTPINIRPASLTDYGSSVKKQPTWVATSGYSTWTAFKNAYAYVLCGV